MAEYIKKSDLESILRKLWKKDDGNNTKHDVCYNKALQEVQCEIDTLEVIDPYKECVQYDSIKAGIQAHAETYSFNIESELFNQLAKEQQGLWRKEIEQACISGGEVGVELARDSRYKENLEMKEVDLDKEIDDYIDTMEAWEIQEAPLTSIENTAKHFYELGIKSKGE